jgi:predicted outer membrane repeat protein
MDDERIRPAQMRPPGKGLDRPDGIRYNQNIRREKPGTAWKGRKMRSQATSILLTAVTLILAIASTALAAPRIIYVDDDAAGANTGSSWADAYRYLQEALADANATHEPVEIRMAQGLYKPEWEGQVAPHEMGGTFQMLNGVTIRGGYAGLGEADPNAWDPSLYETLLSGDQQNDDDIADIRTFYENNSHIVTADGVDATAVLEGVTITHGGYSVPVMRPGKSWEPKGGVGVHNRAGSPTIRRCTFSHNLLLRGWGAALLNYQGAAAHLEQCMFQENYGDSALCDYESTTVLTDCRFIENYGIVVEERTSQAKLENCSFTDNWGTGLSLSKDSHATVSNCVFTGNAKAISGTSVVCTDSVFTGNGTERGLGGAVRIETGTFLRCRFRDNLAGAGGAIYGTNVTLEDCAFLRNVAGSYGAVGCACADIHGCLFAGNRSKGVVGALDISERGKLTNCTIVGNRSKMWGAVDLTPAETTVTNCIIRDNFCEDTSFGEIAYSRTTISFSCVAPPPWQLKELGYVRSGLMDVDPVFVNPGYWDPNGTADDPNDDFWVEGDYHLKSQAGRWDPKSQSWVKDDVTSPCIDTGDPNSPVGDEPEPNGGRVNLGAYGGTAEASKSP